MKILLSDIQSRERIEESMLRRRYPDISSSLEGYRGPVLRYQWTAFSHGALRQTTANETDRQDFWSLRPPTGNRRLLRENGPAKENGTSFPSDLRLIDQLAVGYV